MRRLGLALAAVFLAAAAGCVAVVDDRPGHSSHPHGGPPGHRVVVVDAAHICVDTCDHVHIDGVWYIQTGHRHGAGCGHFLVKGKWGKHKGDDKHDEGSGPKDKDKDKKDKKDQKDKD